WDALQPYVKPDTYGRSTICNIYFDTPDRVLVRTSLEKPVYKEKLRLRTYGVPGPDSPAFVELKKKYKGIVYKRRITLPYGEAYRWLCGGEAPKKDSQIQREIQWFLQFYGGLEPAAALCYDREALYGRADETLRITFDEAIRWRGENTDLLYGDAGTLLLPDGISLMEIKAAGAMPAWLADMLGSLHVYPTSYSKYGSAYSSTLARR
ncbi:MAG: polyphosphate polymerase domain-containing protein, partial [Hominenteromicrobium sp.]